MVAALRSPERAVVGVRRHEDEIGTRVVVCPPRVIVQQPHVHPIVVRMYVVHVTTRQIKTVRVEVRRKLKDMDGGKLAPQAIPIAH